MQRFFFHTADGSRDRDETGTDLPSLHAARAHDITYAGECLTHEPSVLWEGRDFRVEVTDESGTLVFTIITLAIDAPAAARLR